jgi:uncharacterized membrane protein YeaQ/YmgE (transglycosylase-associated protein family)
VIELGFFLALIVGAIIGWLASIVTRSDSQQGPLGSIVIGMVGSLLGGLIWARSSAAAICSKASSTFAPCR